MLKIFFIGLKLVVRDSWKTAVNLYPYAIFFTWIISAFISMMWLATLAVGPTKVGMESGFEPWLHTYGLTATILFSVITVAVAIYSIYEKGILELERQNVLANESGESSAAHGAGVVQ